MAPPTPAPPPPVPTPARRPARRARVRGLPHLLLAAAALAAGGLGAARGCTTLLAGKGATADGSVLSSHSNDAEGRCDVRLVKIPAAAHPPGALRPVFKDTESYPRHVGEDRGAGEYRPREGQAASVPIGHIPEVNYTFAYFEETYGIVNEHQVAAAESTCSGRFTAKAVGYGGRALLSIDALSRIGLERARTAREMVQVMGALAEAHGFYGSSSNFEGGAESLLVSDPQEGWVFHGARACGGRRAGH